MKSEVLACGPQPGPDVSAAPDPGRRRAMLGGAALLLAGAGSANAQPAYPSQPIKWVVCYPAGGGVDAVTRMIAAEMSTRLGQPIVVDNRAGAGGTIGAASVAKAAADGYTVMTLDQSGYTTAQHIYSSLPYVPTRDLHVVATMVRIPFLLVVNASHPSRTFQEFVAYAKQNPGRLNYGSSGVGNPLHVSMEVLQRRTGTSMLHVPYKAMGGLVTDLVSGQINAAIADFGSFRAFLQSGKLRALAVATDARLELLPDVPTFDEVGLKDLPISVWLALAVPRGVPDPIAERLTVALRESMQAPALVERLGAIGIQRYFMGGAQAAEFAQSQVGFWGDVVKPLNIRLD